MPKKKRGARDKKNKKSPWLNERETLFYEQQILDNNRELARLRTTNEELEHEIKTIRQQFTKLEEDRSDIVAYLKRNLTEKIEETHDLNERISALEELRKKELASFKKKEAAMELEYRTMESNLSAEVKLAAGKLNALEDWRIARLDLMHKFEVQNQQLKEQEERHKNTLHAAEKALIVGKAKWFYFISISLSLSNLLWSIKFK
ncbi:serine/threonine-protein kinase dst2 [Vespula squamosa]|uniref:Cilia- and flagella-associated protein 157 n=1 Tax=Vespula squamosa TaxID=30214 RepID=A0ABD1ZVL5_VESSQ